MRKAFIVSVILFSGALFLSCSGTFDNTVWECKYDYKEFQDHMTGANTLEFLPGGKIKGTFSNPGPLPPSVYIYNYTIDGDRITCSHSDVDPRVFTIKDGTLVSEDGHCIYKKKAAAAVPKEQGK